MLINNIKPTIMNLNQALLCLGFILLINAQCPIGLGHDDQGQCVPCTVQHCGFCDGANSDKCVGCIAPFQLTADGGQCLCPSGSGALASGGCGLCFVLNCDSCLDPTSTKCEVCQPNFSNKKTSSGNQCICEAPFMLNSAGECTCPPGQGYDQIRGCKACDIDNCQVCGTSGNQTCSKCFSSALTMENGTKCSCTVGFGPASNLGCAPCQPQNCAQCDNSLVNRCSVCKPNFAKIVNTASTRCVCGSPFIMTPSGDCVCPPGQGPDGQGGCTTCTPNCGECNSQDYDICNVCQDSYILSEDGTNCQCPDGQGKLAGTGCVLCQVSNCKFCQDAGENMCSICNDNFVNLITGSSSECTCTSPLNLTENGQCLCPLGQINVGFDSCVPCADSNCQVCSSPQINSCDVCQQSYELKFNQDKNQYLCECPVGQGPLNGGRCAPCADENCLSCDNSALNLCNLCRVNFTNIQASYQNSTYNAQAGQCFCAQSFVVNQTGFCVCPVATTLDSNGKCQPCAVSNCQDCLGKNSKCSACYAPFVLSEDGNQCRCSTGQILENGTCTPCAINHCLECSSPYLDTCDVCNINFTLVAQQFANDSITILSSTCTCDAPFTLNLNGGCTCPVGLMLNNQGGCSPCQVDGCASCDSPNKCGSCQVPFILSQNKQMCSCPSGQGKTAQGGCGSCSINNCQFCFNAFAPKCYECEGNYTLTSVTSNSTTSDLCSCISPFIVDSSSGECVCPLGMVYNGNGGCDICKVYNCDVCLASNLLQCQQCASPFILGTNNSQCACPVGQGPAQGGCSACSLSNCVHCPLDINQCFICQGPYVLNEKGQCVCPPGSVLNQYGICSKCSVENCAECSTQTATTCQRCHAPALLTYDSTRCQCPPGQSVLSNGGCAPCAVNNCQKCENALLGTCLECQPSFVINADSSKCQCTFGQGPASSGYCEPCKLDFCTECYSSSSTCSICEPPYISNTDGTACICPLGQGSNGQGGCAQCAIENCAVCPSSADEICEQCHVTFDLSSSGNNCIHSGKYQVCELGQGLNENEVCDYCQIENCERCYSSLDTCSICSTPFVSNSDGSGCVCPRGQSKNGAGGCSYCKVDNCQSCASSQAYTCDKCFSPFTLKTTGMTCQQANQDLFDQLWSMLNSPFNKFSSEEMSKNFSSGIGIGILGTLLVLAMAGLIYYCCTKNDKNKKLLENPDTNRGLYSEMQLPSAYKAASV